MRKFVLAVSGLMIVLLAGYVTAESTPAPTTPASSGGPTTMHVDLTTKEGTTVEHKLAVGDKCTLTVKKGKTANTFDVTVTDTAGKKPTKATGTLQEATLAATLDLKKLAKVSWTIIEGDKDHAKDVITLSTTETLPTK